MIKNEAQLRKVIREVLQKSPEKILKTPTKRQWDTLLKAMVKSYIDSGVEGVEDAMPPFEARAKKMNLFDVYDGKVFSFLFRKVRAYRQNLSPSDIETLNDLFLEDTTW